MDTTRLRWGSKSLRITKHIIRSQTSVLTKEELSDFLSVYPVPPEYKVMLPSITRPYLTPLMDSIPLAAPNLLLLPLCAKRMVVSLLFGTGSPSVSINTELPLVETEPLDETNMEQILENVADSGDSPVRQEKLVIHPGSVASRIKDRKCRIRRGYSKPLVKH
ncbi:hypothetical protein Tco_0649925, partial [Tanacetum coccineum]